MLLLNVIDEKLVDWSSDRPSAKLYSSRLDIGRLRELRLLAYPCCCCCWDPAPRCRVSLLTELLLLLLISTVDVIMSDDNIFFFVQLMSHIVQICFSLAARG